MMERIGPARRTGLLALALLVGLAGADGALAQSHKAKGKGNAGGKEKPAAAATKNGSGADSAEDRLEEEVVDEVLDGIFGEDDREIIERYARTKGVATTSLPPGIAKNVQRGKPLPPGIAKRGLPTDLESRLPTLREGLERVIVGDDVTIIEEGTRIVVDVLEDVLRGQ